jgi:hypothetical protein
MPMEVDRAMIRFRLYSPKVDLFMISCCAFHLTIISWLTCIADEQNAACIFDQLTTFGE